MNAIRGGWVVGAMLVMGLGVGCGGGGSSSQGPRDFGSLAASIDSPTGKLDAANATPVAKEFEKIQSTSPGLGGSQESQTQDMSAQYCRAGGSANMSANGSESGGTVHMSYGNCCVQDSCCMNGSIDVVVNANAQDTASYSQCFDVNLSIACEGETATVKTGGCKGKDGKTWYSVQISGKSFSVSGSYSKGSGSLTIKDADGTWTCEYTNGAGACTGATGTKVNF